MDELLMTTLFLFLVGGYLALRYAFRSKEDLNSLKDRFERAPVPVLQWYAPARNAARKYGLPWQVILGQVWQESTGDPEAIGGAGEIGLMQLKPIAIRDIRESGYGRFADWRTNPETNIRAGAAYLHLLKKRGNQTAGGPIRGALEAYNEGMTVALRDLEPDEYAEEVISKSKIFGYNDRSKTGF